MSARTRRRLSELVERFDLPHPAAASLDKLLEILATDPTAPTTITDPVILATDPTAPTTITDPGAAVDAHVADALVALELEPVRRAIRIADLGSGAGFPGLVLAAALPAARVALVESSSKKCAFLARAADAMGLTNVVAVPSRAEEWSDGLGRCDLVTARAVAPLTVLVEYAAPLLAPDGSLVAWKGRRDPAQEADGDAAATATGLGPADVRAVRPWDGAERLHLHLYVKVGATPNRYPRRPGMASKRPLRASA